MDRRAEIREKGLKDLQRSEVLMVDGHFDYGNGYHGRVYLNPHQLFCHPSTIWRFAQDLIDLLPSELVQCTEVVAGPATGGAFNYDAAGRFTLRSFYRNEIKGKRVLLADDVRNTGDTFDRCAALVRDAGGTVLATMEIYDRMESIKDLGVPNVALAEYKAPDNYTASDCPLCKAGTPITRF